MWELLVMSIKRSPFPWAPSFPLPIIGGNGNKRSCFRRRDGSCILSMVGPTQQPGLWMNTWSTGCLLLSCYMKRKEASNLSYVILGSLCYLSLACVLTNGTMQKILIAVRSSTVIIILIVLMI